MTTADHTTGSLARPAIALLAAFTLLTGLAYPALVTGLAQLLFPSQANGSLVTQDGRVVGSRLIGQHVDDPKLFWGRPSATSAVPYDAAASSGSNLGPSNPALVHAVKGRVAALKATPNDGSPVPIDLVTTSGSGLDPDVSPAAALWQIPRVAAANGLSPERVRELVLAHVEPRTLGLLGEPRVNVLELNLALRALAKTP